MREFITVITAIITLVFSGVVLVGCGGKQEPLPAGSMSAQPERAAVNDQNDRRTAAAQAFQSGEGGNALADSEGWKSTATASNVGDEGTAEAKARDPFQEATLEYSYSNNGSQASTVKNGSTAEERSLEKAAKKSGVSSAKATNVRPNGSKAVVADRVFDLGELGGMRYRVQEATNWDQDINQNVHPHLIPVRSGIEGGPERVSHKGVEFVRLNPGTVLFECVPAKNNFIYGLWAVKSLGSHGYNPMQVAALRSMIKGKTQEGYWVLGAYFYLGSELLVETDSPIKVAETPFQSKEERLQEEKSTYQKVMDRIGDPKEVMVPKPEKSGKARGEKSKEDSQKEVIKQ